MREGALRRNSALQLVTVVISLFLFSHNIYPLHGWMTGSLLRNMKRNRMVDRYCRQKSLLQLNNNKVKISGSFFNPVPEPNESNDTSDDDVDDTYDDDADVTLPLPTPLNTPLPTPQSILESKAIQPSTINGIPSEQVVAFDLGMTLQTARQNDPITRNPFVGIGPSSLNDVTKPEYDDQGYTLYVDENTGKKARVFEALVQYPCLFTLKIVGANDNTFVSDVLKIVAATCQIDDNDDNDNVVETTTTTTTTSISTSNNIEHSIKYNGKWASITVQAPVQNAQMLYQLYENVDRDPRVKFKF